NSDGSSNIPARHDSLRKVFIALSPLVAVQRRAMLRRMADRRSRKREAMTVSAEAARRFLVTRHMLAPARSLKGGPDAVLEVFRRLGSIQFDPLAVAGRNHDLVLHARVADYDPTWCEELLYARRELFEAYNKGLSLLPTSELPWYRVSWQLSASRHEQGILA